jgi:general secretion pathway protein G
MIVVAIIAILASIGVPMYRQTKEHARQVSAVSELRTISFEIDRFVIMNGEPPDSLTDVDMDDKRDPWGRPYQYLRLDTIGTGTGKGKGKGGVGKARKDHNLVPINTDYDLYSMGADGKSASPLTAEISRDDIVRAQDGNYFGLAADY